MVSREISVCDAAEAGVVGILLCAVGILWCGFAGGAIALARSVGITSGETGGDT